MYNAQMLIRYLAIFLAAFLAFPLAPPTLAAGEENDAPFHDFAFLDPEDYMDLVDPAHPEVCEQASEFRTVHDAYRFVRDKVRYEPHRPATDPAQALKDRAGSCLGKATLLCSLYRAMGVEPEKVRLVTGIVMTPEGPTDHVWVDLEVDGMCIQQDPSGLLGKFSFNEFLGNSFVDNYVIKEIFCFNDEDFGIVSQINRLKSKIPPQMREAMGK